MAAAATVRSPEDLGTVLRMLRRREARGRGGAERTYRSLAAAAGWSYASVAEYFSGRALPPTDRFDVLVRLLGAGPSEMRALASARDRVEDIRLDGQSAPAVLPPTADVPRQLPADVRAWTGRVAEMEALERLLTPAAGPGSPPPVAALVGPGGAGKTALAVHWCHRSEERWADGQLFLDLRGCGPQEPLPPGEALGTLLGGLGVSDADLPASTAARAAAYRSRLAGRRVLVVLDNAADSDQARPLLPAGPGCATVVTSRDDLAGLVARDGAERIVTGELAPADGQALLQRLAGEAAGTPELAAAVSRRCGALPLTLRIAAEMLACGAVTVTDLIDDPAGPLELFDAAGGGTTAVREVLSWSLARQSAALRHTFAHAGLHPGSDFDAEALAALTGVEPSGARRSAEQLARSHLLTRPAPGRYGLHDLLREYARSLITDPARAQAALARLVGHYLDAAETIRAAGATGPGTDRWLDTELDTVLRVAATGGAAAAAALSQALARVLDDQARYRAALELHSTAVGAARGAGRADLPDLLANRGGTLIRLGRYAEAITDLEAAGARHREAGSPAGEARALGNLGAASAVAGRHVDAYQHTKAALALYRGLGDRDGECWQLVNLGHHCLELRRWEEAERHLAGALGLAEACGDPATQGYAHGSLGILAHRTGRQEDALTHLEDSLMTSRRFSDRHGQATALRWLGSVRLELGQTAIARDCYEQSLALADTTGDPAIQIDALLGLGDLLDSAGDDAATEHYRRAGDIAASVGDSLREALALQRSDAR